jgi:hypothetical protein
MLGIIAYPEEPSVVVEEAPLIEESFLQSLTNVMQSEVGIGAGVVLLSLIILLMFLTRIDPPLGLEKEALSAELIE